MPVRHRDGSHFELESPSVDARDHETDARPRVVADARSAVGSISVVSHAHADHTFRSSPETEYGYRARPLKRDQTALEELC